MTDRLYGATDACEHLGISRSTLTQWIAKGWIKPQPDRPGRAYLFTGAELARADAERRVRIPGLETA